MTTEEIHFKDNQVFNKIFHPQSIAVVGVSAQGAGFGIGIFLALQSMGYEGKLFPVNPKGGMLSGIKIYEDVDSIPQPIDFAIIAVPAHLVPEALESCRKKGAAGAEILSAGFSETGTQEGISLEKDIKKIADKGIRVIGPNCFGVYCPASGLTLLPGPDLSRQSGSVAMVSQSGGMAIDLAHMGKWMGIRFSKVISIGNGADIRETELLKYLTDDPETRVICMYIEGVADGREFLKALKMACVKKPVIVYKGGLTESGSRAVASHTASMGGSRVIWESVLRQTGAVQVSGLWEMAQVALAFSMLPPRVYKGIIVAGGGGALGVSACDLAESYGLELPVLDEVIREQIVSLLPKPGSSASNPIDAANPFVAPSIYGEVLLEASKDRRIDLQIVVQLLYHYKSLAIAMGIKSLHDITPYKELAQNIYEVVQKTGKPVILVLSNIKQGLESMDIEEVIRTSRHVFLEKGIPVFENIDHALKAVNHVSDYYARRGIS